MTRENQLKKKENLKSDLGASELSIDVERKLKSILNSQEYNFQNLDNKLSRGFIGLAKEAEGPTYKDVRLRLALCILAVTGIRFQEGLTL